jgi:hypothetical protein
MMSQLGIQFGYVLEVCTVLFLIQFMVGDVENALMNLDVTPEFSLLLFLICSWLAERRRVTKKLFIRDV